MRTGKSLVFRQVDKYPLGESCFGVKKRIMKIVKFIIAACFLGITFGYAQTFVSESEIKAQKFGTETLYKSYRTDEPLEGDYKVALGAGSYYEVRFNKGRMHGKYKRFSPQSDLLEERTYVNGELDGKKTVYFEFAKNMVHKVSYYKKGKPEGKWQEYDTRGTLIQEDNFSDGQLHGQHKKFDSQGDLRLLESYKNGAPHGKWWGKVRSNRGDYEYTNFYKEGEPTGKWTEVNENGTLKKEVEYSNKDTYVKREYYRNGKLHREVRVKNGKYNGISKEFSDTGVISEENDYKDDEIISKKTYHDNGRPNQTWHLVKDQLHGKYLSFNSDGEKQVEGNYTYGLRDGVWKYYHQDKDNLLQREVTYVGGNKEGVFKSYYRSGKVASEGFYKNDQMDGLWKYYTEGGKLKKEEVYDQRNLVKSTEY